MFMRLYSVDKLSSSGTTERSKNKISILKRQQVGS